MLKLIRKVGSKGQIYAIDSSESAIKIAKKYANLLGYNYQSSQWYERSYKIFNKEYKTSYEIKKDKQSVFKRFKKLFK